MDNATATAITSPQVIWWADFLKMIGAAFIGALFAFVGNVGISWIKERQKRRSSLARVLFCIKNQLSYLEWVLDNFCFVYFRGSSIEMDYKETAKVHVTLDFDSIIFLIDKNESKLLFDIVSIRDDYLRFKKSFEKRQKLQEKLFMDSTYDKYGEESVIFEQFSSSLLEDLPIIIDKTKNLINNVLSYMKK